MTDKIELRPCTCGSDDHSIGYESPQGYWVECGDCGWRTGKNHDRQIAIEAWSRRAALAQQPAPVAFAVMTGDKVRELSVYRGQAETYSEAWNSGGMVEDAEIVPLGRITSPPAAEQPNHVERNLNMAEQPAPVAVPEEFLLVTPEQVERHSTTAWE